MCPCHCNILAQTRGEYRRRAAALVELMTAAVSADAEEEVPRLVTAFSDIIDEAMLALLARRIDAAQMAGQV
jgi:chorismate mutase